VLLGSFTSVLFSLIPKKKNRWVFSSWFGKRYEDNPKYFYEYCKKKEEIDVVWVTKIKTQVDDLRLIGVNAHYCWGMKGIYYQLTAGYCFFSHDISAEFENCFISRTTKRCQLWHGIPLKKIGFDDNKQSFKMNFFRGKKLLRYFYNEFYTIVVSSGEKFSKIFSNAYYLNYTTFVTSGFPRNEIYHSTRKPNKIKKIIYMPTFRGDAGSEFDIISVIGLNYKETSSILNEINAELIIRLHPVNQMSSKINKKYKNITFQVEGDANLLLASADCLITDYSSVMFDFNLTGKPILFFPFDLESYVNKGRELYFNYEEVIPSEYLFKSWSKILTHLAKMNFNEKPVNAFLDSFHDVDASNYSEILFDYITKSQLK
jgi:CDP-glycerol glycerophosphotransferase